MTELTPGQVTNKLIHEHVMGLCAHDWSTVDDPDDDMLDSWIGTCSKCADTRGGTYQQLGPVSGKTPYYSTDIAAAFTVLNKMRADGWQTEHTSGFPAEFGGSNFWEFSRDDKDAGGCAYSDSDAFAICCAALVALGVEL